MKSDFTMDSRYRSEGRISLPRRRVATKTCSENGDFEMELSLAIKESLKYAKEKELQLKQMDKRSSLFNGVQCDNSHSRMAGNILHCASSTEKDQGQGHLLGLGRVELDEVEKLKDLLLIHIELIQQQQELLANKDKEILTLRNEKDTLQWRLQKTEKRMVQMKQKEDMLEMQIANARDFAVAAETTAISRLQEKSKLVKSEQTSIKKRKRRQHSKTVLPSKVKKYSIETGKTLDSLTSGEQNSDAENSDTADEENVTKGNSDKEEAVNSIVQKGLQKTSDEEENEEEVVEGKGEDENRDPHPEPVLRTDCLYHMSSFVEPLTEEVDEVPEDNSEKDVVMGDEVETPGWRINILTNRYQLEGTENITDEAYQKRHQKHELEEKRRKRWDIQRLREQQVFEKLRGKEEATTSTTDSSTFKTYFPSIDDLTHIEISETVPVMAFGQAVPQVQPSEFELPWESYPVTRKSPGWHGRQK